MDPGFPKGYANLLFSHFFFVENYMKMKGPPPLDQPQVNITNIFFCLAKSFSLKMSKNYPSKHHAVKNIHGKFCPFNEYELGKNSILTDSVKFSSKDLKSLQGLIGWSEMYAFLSMGQQ